MNATGSQVKSAFAQLERAWARQDVRPTFFLNHRWSFVGAFVTAPRNNFSWSETIEESQELKFSIAGDSNVRALSVTVTKVGEKDPASEGASGEAFMSDSFVAPSSGRYRFSIGCQSKTSRPTFILFALESGSGHSVGKGAMAELGDVAGLMYSEATSTGFDVKKNAVSLMGGAFNSNSSKSVIDLNADKAPYTYVGGFEGDRQTLLLNVTDQAGKVIVKDPGDEDLPYVLVDRLIPRHGLNVTNRSRKPRICFVAGFQIK
jgi:hypothetical protein